MQFYNSNTSFSRLCLFCFEGGRLAGGAGESGSLHAVCCCSVWLAIIRLLKPLYWAVQTLWRLVRYMRVVSEAH